MVCDRCHLPIAGNPADPVHVTSLGTHHEACMRAAWSEHAAAERARQEAASARRSAAMKARWAESAGTETPASTDE